MTWYEIPLTAGAQKFTITLASVEYQARLDWCAADQGGWLLSLADATGAPLAAGIPLVTGADLLGQYAYLGIGGALYVTTDGDPDAAPTYANLGGLARLYWVPA